MKEPYTFCSIEQVCWAGLIRPIETARPITVSWNPNPITRKNFRKLEPNEKTTTQKYERCQILVLQFVDYGFKSCDSSWNSKGLSCWNWEWEDGSITTILITNGSLHFPCLPVPSSSSCHCQSFRPLLRSNNLISPVLTLFLSHFKFPSLFYKQRPLCLSVCNLFLFLGRGVIV